MAPTPFKQQAHGSFVIFPGLQFWPETNCFVLSKLAYIPRFCKALFRVLNLSVHWDSVSADIFRSSAYTVSHYKKQWAKCRSLMHAYFNFEVITVSLGPANSGFYSVYKHIISRTRFLGTLFCLRAHGISFLGTVESFFELNKYIQGFYFLQIVSSIV